MSKFVKVQNSEFTKKISMLTILNALIGICIYTLNRNVSLVMHNAAKICVKTLQYTVIISLIIPHYFEFARLFLFILVAFLFWQFPGKTCWTVKCIILYSIQ